MIKELIKNLTQAKTSKDILGYKFQIIDTYNTLFKKICSQSCSITNYDDIKNIQMLGNSMSAYYGLNACFYRECGVPFLKEHNLETIDIIELSILFYSLQILELLENGFWTQSSLCIYGKSLEIFERTETIDFIKRIADRQSPLFMSLWYYFYQIISFENNEREISFEWENSIDVFYIDDDKYEEVLDMTLKNYKDSKYSSIIDSVLGIYRVRFTKMQYILNYQPLFVEVGYYYLCAY